MPFEQARTLLCEGEALRRARRPAASRLPLHRALTVFNGLGAEPWAARAMTELAAAGARTRDGTSVSALDSLSPQERRILGLIAEGLTNRQIGERLFLAEKTVKNYVSSLLAKLGMERRTQAAVFATRLLHPDPH